VRLDGHRQELDNLPTDLGVPYWDATAAGIRTGGGAGLGNGLPKQEGTATS